MKTFAMLGLLLPTTLVACGASSTQQHSAVASDSQDVAPPPPPAPPGMAPPEFEEGRQVNPTTAPPAPQAGKIAIGHRSARTATSPPLVSTAGIDGVAAAAPSNTSNLPRSTASRVALGLRVSDRPMGFHVHLWLDLGPRWQCHRSGRRHAVRLPLHPRLWLDLVRLSVGCGPLPLWSWVRHHGCRGDTAGLHILTWWSASGTDDEDGDRATATGSGVNRIVANAAGKRFTGDDRVLVVPVH